MRIAARKKSTFRVPVTRERALGAAIHLADTKGLDALTMRALARELGVEAMSLYHHVANKDDVLNGMVDLVFAEVEVPQLSDWQEAMRQRAHSMRAALTRHRWAIGLLESRRAPGVATLTHHDAVLRCLRSAGFSLALTAHAYALLDSYIYGFAQQEAALPFQTGDETQALASDMMEAFPKGAYPHLVELTVKHVFKPGYAFANEFGFGLELILDGLARRRRRGAAVKAMKQVSIQALKSGLSAAVAEAQAGHTIVITRHNTPVAQIGPTATVHVHHGTRVGGGRIRPALKRGTNGRYLAVLLDDRGTR